MENVQELINSINDNRSDISSSRQDELRVMQAMLNDKDFKVDVYGKSGIEGVYSPYEDSRLLVTKILKETTKIPNKEAMELSNNYEFGRQEAQIMINLSKEFVNTYIETGRKLPLGGREKSNVALSKKVKEPRNNTYPKKIGVNDDGTDKYENVTDGIIPEHNSIKVHGGCPSWIKPNN